MRTTTIAICTLLLLSSSAWARESSSDVEIVDGRRLEKVKVTTDADVAALAQIRENEGRARRLVARAAWPGASS